MRICICCFGLFHRPKLRPSSYIPSQSQLQSQSNQNNTSTNYILKIRRRSFLFPAEPLNKIKEINKTIPRYLSPELKPRQSKVREKKSLYELKDTFRCLFCGGTKCPCEDYTTNPKTPIKGLNCDIIDNEIYASQRPSNTLIEEFNLIKKFHQYKIGMIVNLQRPGEHPYCGKNALEPLSGYSYSPSLFSSEGIIVKLAGWKDMDIPDSLYFMLDIIKDIYKKIKIDKKRVLVHCHAGNGRTGVVIACYLIYKSNYQAEEAVGYLRKIRKKCVEKSSQMKYCIKFRKFLNTLRKVFTNDKNDVDYFIKHQCDLEIDPIKKNLYMPKLFWLVFDIISDLRNNYDNNQIYKALNGSSEVTEENFQEIIDMKDKIDSGDWNCLINNKNVTIISETLYHWLDDSVTFCIRPKKILEISNDRKLMYQIDEVLLGYASEDKIHNIYNALKNSLKKVETEILNYIANFFVKIYPADDKDDIVEYKRMVEKISVYILGFNIELLYNYKLQFENNNNGKENNTITNLNKINEGEEIDANSGLNLYNCIKAVENTILLLEFLKIRITYHTANENKDIDSIINPNGEINNKISCSNMRANLLKSVIISKENEILSINNSRIGSIRIKNVSNITNNTYNSNNIHVIDSNINLIENSPHRKIKYNLFSERKPFERKEDQIKIIRERSLTPYKKNKREQKSRDSNKKVSRFKKTNE